MAYIISFEDLKKLVNNRNAAGAQAASGTTITYTINGTEGEQTINTGKKTGTASLYFKNFNNISNFQYIPEGKNLKIIAGDLTVTVVNYFSKADSSATKSIIKYIRYNDETGALQTKNIINEGFIHSPAELQFNPVKGVITGTVFSDTITANLETPYGKNNKGFTINGGKGNDVITGTKFNDTITGGAGINTLIFDFADGFGNDVINITNGEMLILDIKNNGTPVALEDLVYTKSGNNLLVTKAGDTDNKLTIKNYFKNASAVYLYVDDNNKSLISGYLRGDSILNITGKGTIKGTGYGDNITGSTKADVISTGAGTDTVNAGAKNDTIKLGAGNKTVKISNTDGNDKITLSNTTSVNIVYDDTVDTDKLVFAKSYNKKDLYIFRENNQYTIVKNYFKGNLVTTDLKVNGSNIIANAMIYNLSEDNKITLTADSYSILGNQNDSVAVKAGNNTVNLLKGNDSVSFAKTYEGTTTIKTSGGTDSILIKEAVKNDISVEKDGDDFEIKVKKVNEDESVSYHTVAEIENYKNITSKINIKDSNNKVVNTLKSGSGKISGTAYNDFIIAGTGNDTITGGKGNDEIYTRGGTDTIVLTGSYGHDTVYSDGSEKVTLKLDSMNARDNFSYDIDDLSDLTYTKNGSNSVTYKDFFKEGAADLWIKKDKQAYHVINDKNNIADYAENQNNNVVYLTKDGQSYYGAEYNKSINVVNSLNNTELNYSGSNDYYMSKGDYSNDYNLTLDGNTKLYILDEGGEDTISLANTSENVALLFNVSTKDEIADTGILIYNQDDITYNKLMSGYPNGRIEVENYFAAGEIENMSTSDYVIDLKGWVNFVSDKAKEWLTEHNKESLAQMIMAPQTKANKNAIAQLLNVYKEATYDKYVESITNEDLLILKNEEQTALTFVKSGNDLGVYNDNQYLTTIKNYFTSENVKTIYYALNNGKLTEYEIGTTTPVQVLLREDSVDFYKDEDDLKIYNGTKLVETGVDYFNSTDKTKYYSLDANGELAEYAIGSTYPIHIKDDENLTIDSTITELVLDNNFNNSTLNLIFEDKQFLDFYTKKSAVLYTEGDPLIYKGGLNQGAKESDWKNGGNGLTVGDVYIENADGKTGEILLDTKDGTKTIILGQGTINGTFESEVISGSNTADVINSYGGDDLIYSGDGNDTLNFVKSEGGDATGKNTARMVVIGGSDYLPEDHPVNAISAYDTSGDDTYNTSFDVGLYIEDNGGTNDVINIDATKSDSTKSSLRYMFDVAKPGKESKLYTDLFIYDSKDNGTMFSAILQTGSMEGMQGQFGYVWIDDYYSSTQKVETVNLVNGDQVEELSLTYTEAGSDTNAVYQAISAWLSTKSAYDTAWDVVKATSMSSYFDKLTLFNLYQNGGAS